VTVRVRKALGLTTVRKSRYRRVIARTVLGNVGTIVQPNHTGLDRRCPYNVDPQWMSLVNTTSISPILILLLILGDPEIELGVQGNDNHCVKLEGPLSEISRPICTGLSRRAK